MQRRTRKLIIASVATVVAVVVGVVLILEFATGTREVPRAMDGDAPSRDLADVPDDVLVDLDAARTATFAEGSAHLRYRHRIDGEIRQVGVGRIDFDEYLATVGIAGTSQLFADEVVLLRFGQSGPWARTDPAELSSARGEPVPGESSPWAAFELVARASDARLVGEVVVSGIELAQIAAVTDVSAARDNIADDLAALADQMRNNPGEFEEAFVDLDHVEQMLAHTQAHDGTVPIEVWIDADQRIWRITYDLADWNPPVAGDMAEPTTFALDLRGFGSAGEITWPDETEIVELDELDETMLPAATP